MRNLEKNGYPHKSVAFPLERMYEAAANKGLSFNRVLERLEVQGVSHEKTPERIIFRPAPPPKAFDPASLPFDPSSLPGLDQLQGMSPEQMMQAAAQAMQQLSPDQQQAIMGMVQGMSDEDRAQMLERAKKLGIA